VAVPAPFLTTDRLALRRFVADDLDWFVELYGDAEVTRYLGGPKDRAKTTDMFHARILDYYDANQGLGIWLTTERATGARLGFHLINNVQGETLIQVWFALSKSAWGRGIGTEMASALVRYAFVTLKLPRLVAIASLENLASQRVLTKIGLERRGERAFSHPAYAAAGPLAWFERDAADWLAERRMNP